MPIHTQQQLQKQHNSEIEQYMNIFLPSKIKTKIQSLGFLLIFLFLLSVIASPVAAIETGRIGAYPTTYDQSNPLTRSWFIYSLPAGDNKEDKVTAVNNSEETITVKVYAVDATTTKDGAFALFNEEDKRTGVGSWVKLSESEVTLKPKERKDIAFTITIPKDTTIGDHAGGIIFQEVKPKSVAKEGININIISRVGVRIYETVPGAQQLHLEVNDFQYKLIDNKLVFSFTMENKGNVFLNPKGSLEIKDVFGKSVEKITLDTLGTVVPGKPTTIDAKSKIEKPILGRYTAMLRVEYGAGKVAAKEISFFTVNWMIVIPILIGILILVTFGIIFFLRRRHTRTLSMEGADTTPEKTSFEKMTPSTGKKQFSEQTVARGSVIPSHHTRLVVALILMSILAVSFGFAFFLQHFSISILPKTTGSAPESIPAPQESGQQPTSSVATESASEKSKPIEKDNMKVIVLNGTAKIGIAKTVADKLTKAGFIVTKVDNAESQDYTHTVVQFPKGQPQAAQLLIEQLGDEYKNVKKEELQEGNEFTIILGLP